MKLLISVLDLNLSLKKIISLYVETVLSSLLGTMMKMNVTIVQM